jgi:glycosyltransferase involved in cell wall biosynthesis
MGGKNVQILSQVGLLAEEVEEIGKFSPSEPVSPRFLSVGRFLHWKGFHLGLQAFSKANLPPEVEYWLIGKGPEEAVLRSMAIELGIDSQVKFLSEMPRTDLIHKLGTCLALVHPSLHDSGAFVCLEAMAAGRPVICLDLGGPAVQITQETGFKIPATNPEEAINGMAIAMNQLAIDPELCSQLGTAGQKRVNETFNWKTKGKFLVEVYETITIPTQKGE